MTKPLQFTWTSVGSDGTDVPLFIQQVDVKPGQRAYATALSPGRLALGAYRVKVAVAGATETVGLYVALPAAEEPLTAAAVGAATAATGPPATSASGLVRRREPPTARSLLAKHRQPGRLVRPARAKPVRHLHKRVAC